MIRREPKNINEFADKLSKFSASSLLRMPGRYICVSSDLC